MQMRQACLWREREREGGDAAACDTLEVQIKLESKREREKQTKNKCFVHLCVWRVWTKLRKDDTQHNVFVPKFEWIVLISTMFLSSLLHLNVEIRLSGQLQINSNQGGSKHFY